MKHFGIFSSTKTPIPTGKEIVNMTVLGLICLGASLLLAVCCIGLALYASRNLPREEDEETIEEYMEPNF